jgi:proline iminopeptidase
VAQLYPEIEPFSNGMLDVGGGNEIYWEMCGNPAGKTALVLHGGPGSGCAAWHRRLFDPARYRIVLFDQRNCGRSVPHAGALHIDLSTNTTDHLIADIEALRLRLDVQRWLVLGGSWGSALALAYAVRFVHRVSEIVLFGVTTGRREEFDWLFRDGLARLFPAEWQRRRDAIPSGEQSGDIVEAYSRLLHDPAADVRARAAHAWCLWESATPDWPPQPGLAPRFRDPSYALAFARIVTHYVRHDAWLGDGVVMREIERLAKVPSVLINGRYDLQAPLATAWELQRRWPGSELVVIDDAGHSASDARLTEAIVAATDRFAAA